MLCMQVKPGHGSLFHTAVFVSPAIPCLPTWTSIRYGDVTPETDPGRVCIFIVVAVMFTLLPKMTERLYQVWVGGILAPVVVVVVVVVYDRALVMGYKPHVH